MAGELGTFPPAVWRQKRESNKERQCAAGGVMGSLLAP